MLGIVVVLTSSLAAGAETTCPGEFTQYGQIFLANGSAPPDPANVWDDVCLETGHYFISNGPCPYQGGCIGAGTATHVDIVDGARIAYEVPYEPPASKGYHRVNLTFEGSSTLHMRGGHIGWPDEFNHTPGYLFVRDQATAIISGGLLENMRVNVSGAARLEMSGGEVDGTISATDHLTQPEPEERASLIEMSGGVVDGVSASGWGIAMISGGHVRSIVSSTVNGYVRISGGTFGSEEGALATLSQNPWQAPGTETIEIVGRDFTLNGVPLGYGFLPPPPSATSQTLRGVLASGEPFAFERAPTAIRVRLVAEPTPLADGDGDGVPDLRDLCPDVADPTNADTDLDFIGDACNDEIDADGDDVADALDNCPSQPNPSQRDTNFNGVGDACNDLVDADGDEFEDDVDTCPFLPSANQLDRDEDGLGDLCDPYPDDTWNYGALADLVDAHDEIASLELQRDIAQAAYDACIADPPYLDADGDGEHDDTDRCPGTPAGEAVDEAGCALAQFCAAIDPGEYRARFACARADWRNDEPEGMPFDCVRASASGPPSCEAAPAGRGSRSGRPLRTRGEETSYDQGR